MICATETRTALYRFYDARENLLYVGITDDPWRRWREHVLTQPWYPQVKHQSVTWYDTEWLAREAETRAIRSERPHFNIAGAIRPPEARLTLSFDAVIHICAIWATVPGVLGFAVLFAAISIPAHSAAVPYLHAVGWAVVVATLSLPVPLLTVLTVGCAPWIYRFGCWLNRNFGDHDDSSVVPGPVRKTGS